MVSGIGRFGAHTRFEFYENVIAAECAVERAVAELCGIAIPA